MTSRLDRKGAISKNTELLPIIVLLGVRTPQVREVLERGNDTALCFFVPSSSQGLANKLSLQRSAFAMRAL